MDQERQEKIVEHLEGLLVGAREGKIGAIFMVVFDQDDEPKRTMGLGCDGMQLSFAAITAHNAATDLLREGIRAEEPFLEDLLEAINA